MGYFD
jgi:hypothetical protein